MTDPREPKACPKCGQMCTYDGWDHVHTNGVGIGSCPQVEATYDGEELHDKGTGMGEGVQ